MTTVALAALSPDSPFTFARGAYTMSFVVCSCGSGECPCANRDVDQDGQGNGILLLPYIAHRRARIILPLRWAQKSCVARRMIRAAVGPRPPEAVGCVVPTDYHIFVANRAEVLYDKVMTRSRANGTVTTMIWDGTDYLGEVN